MTLILTELSKHGIAMVADSAVTFTEQLPSGKPVNYVLNGAQKLQVVPYLTAGISVWGLGAIEGVSTDIWLHDFIERHSDIHSLDEFANNLVAELRTTIG